MVECVNRMWQIPFLQQLICYHFTLALKTYKLVKSRSRYIYQLLQGWLWDMEICNTKAVGLSVTMLIECDKSHVSLPSCNNWFVTTQTCFEKVTSCKKSGYGTLKFVTLSCDHDKLIMLMVHVHWDSSLFHVIFRLIVRLIGVRVVTIKCKCVLLWTVKC